MQKNEHDQILSQQWMKFDNHHKCNIFSFFAQRAWIQRNTYHNHKDNPSKDYWEIFARIVTKELFAKIAPRIKSGWCNVSTYNCFVTEY